LRKYFLIPIQNLALISEGLYWNAIEGGVDLPALEKDQVAITPDHAEKFKAVLLDHGKHVRYLELKESLKYVRLMLKKFSDGDYKYEEYKRDVEVLQGREEHELEDIIFGFIPPDKMSYFENKELFGKVVAERFPSAAQDIEAAANCYAHDLHTACVFHLMRAVELGTRRVLRGMNAGKHLKRPVELCTWGELIAALEEGLKGLTVGKRTSTVKASTFGFYNHAVGVFRNFKGAWRDPVSHTGKQYKPGETKDTMDNTRQFMQHLATRLKE
jgi:hypothetical protein